MAAEHPPRLRPLSLGDLLDELFALYRRGFKTLLGISALPYVPFAVLMLPLSTSSAAYVEQISELGADPAAALSLFSNWVLAAAAIAILVSAVGSILGLAATCFATAGLYLGQVPTVEECYRSALGRFWRLFRLGLLIGLLFLGLALVGVMFAVFPPLLCLSLPAVFAGFIYLGVLWSLSTPALVLENGPGAVWALGRSRDLLRGAWLRTFATLLIILLLLTGLQSIATALASAIGASIDAVVAPDSSQPAWLAVLNSLLGSVVSILFAPFFYIGITLLYYDRRIRAEAYDLTVMARELTAAPGTSLPSPGPPGLPAPDQPGLPPPYGPSSPPLAPPGPPPRPPDGSSP